MAKLFAGFGLLGVLTFTVYFFFFRPPSFTGPNAEYRQLLWQFEREEDPAARFLLATRIQLSPLSVKLKHLMKSMETHLGNVEASLKDPKSQLAEAPASPPDTETGLSDAEKEAARRALAYFEDLNGRAEKFEASLSPKDITYVTEGNQGSLYRKLGTFTPKGPCGAGEVAALRNEMGEKPLEDRAASVMLLATGYEERHRASYRRRKRELLEREERFADQRDLLPLYSDETAAELKKSYASMFDDTGIEARIASAELDLARTGIDAHKAPAYVSDLAVRYPGCFARINVEFMRELRGGP